MKPQPAGEGEDEPAEPENPNAEYELEEKCLVRIQNYRDPLTQEEQAAAAEATMKASTISKADHASAMSVGEGGSQAKNEAVSDTSSQKAIRQIDAFEIEKLSQKVIMLKPLNADHHEGSLMMHHSEAVLFLRRHIIEKAKNFWKEGKEMNTNNALGLTAVKQKYIDSAFERHCIERLGYEMGEQVEDQNIRITFKTFLKRDDPRLDE